MKNRALLRLVKAIDSSMEFTGTPKELQAFLAVPWCQAPCVFQATKAVASLFLVLLKVIFLKTNWAVLKGLFFGVS